MQVIMNDSDRSRGAIPGSASAKEEKAIAYKPKTSLTVWINNLDGWQVQNNNLMINQIYFIHDCFRKLCKSFFMACG